MACCIVIWSNTLLQRRRQLLAMSAMSGQWVNDKLAEWALLGFNMLQTEAFVSPVIESTVSRASWIFDIANVAGEGSIVFVFDAWVWGISSPLFNFFSCSNWQKKWGCSWMKQGALRGIPSDSKSSFPRGDLLSFHFARCIVCGPPLPRRVWNLRTALCIFVGVSWQWQAFFSPHYHGSRIIWSELRKEMDTFFLSGVFSISFSPRCDSVPRPLRLERLKEALNLEVTQGSVDQISSSAVSLFLPVKVDIYIYNISSLHHVTCQLNDYSKNLTNLTESGHCAEWGSGQ